MPRRHAHAAALCLCLLAWAAGARAQAPVFDVHVHLREGGTSLREYRADAARDGIELAGIGAMWFGGPRQARQGDPDAIRRGNDGVIALARAHEDVVPIATVHPYDGDAALEELARVAGLGVGVLKLHPHTQRFDAADPRVRTLARRAGELGMVVMFDNAGILPGDSEKLFDLAVQVPGTRFLFAHAGGMGFRFWNVLALARTADGFGMDNVFFDLSATVVAVAGSPVADEFVWTLRNMGIDRVLAGSDYPQFGLSTTVEALRKLGLDDAERAKILSGNARRLFGSGAAAR